MIGRTLGHYRILEKLGAGGMGEVYRAHDEQLERDVALKVLPAGKLADEAARKQFRKEALALAKLNHPNIETVLEFNKQDGLDFLVIEFIPGLSLSEKLKEGPLPESQILRLGAQFAGGLAAAHAHGVIHRDLKPGNLMITADGRLKVLDFGLAKLLRPSTDPAATQSATESHALAGTLPYMPPERLRGEPADVRSDIFAAGAVLYEMATGQRPFANMHGTRLIDAILHQTPQPASSLNRGVSPALEAVIEKALDKDPEHRYQSAQELRIDLERMGVPTDAPLLATAPDQSQVPTLEIAHVLFIDIVAYSKMPMDKQQKTLRNLQKTVQATAEFTRAEARDELIRLPTGDGMALVFFEDPEAPVRCALELSRALHGNAETPLRMGIHAGPVYRVADINANRNVAGGGINIAQRVMDCGDAGHILVSETVASVLNQLSGWADTLHDLGEAEVKHGVRVHLFNLYTADAGNPDRPKRRSARESQRPGITKSRAAIRLTGTILAIIFGLAGATYLVYENYFRSPKAALAFQGHDSIVIADFENLTGDQVFNRSLQTALTVGIQQSQYVSVLPPVRVQEALRRMRKESEAKLDEALASDLAVREGAKAVLVCSIAEVGGMYSLTARLVEPSSRAIVLTEVTKAAGKDQVLPALDSMAKAVRQELGESLMSVSRQSLPLPRATTASLEALKTYADGKKLAATNIQAGYDLIRQAVAIDPDFALAHADLGVQYYIWGNKTQGEEHFVKALSLMDRLTLREKLWIRAVVEDWRGNREQAVEYYKTYLAQYPDDSSGWFRLGWTYMAALGQREKAIEAFKRELEISPSDVGAYINLASCYNGLGQYETAVEYYEKGFKLNPSAITGIFVNHEYGFMLVKMGNPQKALETFQKMISEGENSKKARGYRSMAILDMYQGKYSQAISNLKQAIVLNKVSKGLESEFRDRMFLASAYRTKDRNADFASELVAAHGILSQARFGPGWIILLVKTYARMGKTREATKLLHQMVLQAQNPTAISGITQSGRRDQAYIYIGKGEIALSAGRASEAMESLELGDKLDPGSGLESLAFGYRILGKPQDAAGKYQEIVAKHLTWLGNENQEQWIIAHYQLGKIYDELGETQKAKENYEKFLSIWKDADPDINILQQAKAEYAKLK